MKQTRIALPFTAAALLLAANAMAEAPGLMTVQGRLVDNGQLVNNGSLNLRLNVYETATGGLALYTELDSVAVVDGLYSTILGDNRAGGNAATLPEALRTAGTNAWLGVTVLGNPEMAPRRRLLSVPYAMNAVDPDDLGPIAYRLADAFVVVQTTDSAATNGQNLLAAYVSARSVEPNGSSRSADNRVAVIVPPGQYDLGGGSFTLQSNYIDLIGLSSAPGSQVITGRSTGTGYGVLQQTANDVRIQNLTVRCTYSATPPRNNSSDPAAYFPSSDGSMTVIRNCRFESSTRSRPTRTHVTYAGTYTDCEAGNYAFGFGGTASGTFRDCTGGIYSFGGAGTAPGVFRRCRGGNYSFAGSGLASGDFYDCEMTGTAWGGTLSGTIEGSHWGALVSVNAAGKVLRSTVAGVFRHDGNAEIDGDLTVDSITADNLGPLAGMRTAAMVLVDTTDNETTNGQNLLDAYTTATGMTPHGMARSGSNRVVVIVPPGRYNLGSGQLWLSQNFIDVIGLSPVRENQYVFGTTAGTGSGVLRQSANDVRIENLFVECTRDSSNVSTPDSSDPAAYFPNGGLSKTVVRNCRFSATYDANRAWTMRAGVGYAGTYEDVVAGKSSFGFGADASGTFTRCTAGQDSFGSGNGGTASGDFFDCLGTPYSFGGTRSGTSRATGFFRNCTYQNDDGEPILYWGGTFSGRMEGCTWKAPLTLGDGAVVYNSTIVGNVIGSGVGDCKVAHTRAWNIVLGSLSNVLSNPANVVGPDVE